MKTGSLLIARTALMAATLLGAGVLSAQPSGTPPAGGPSGGAQQGGAPHHKPPQEALDACKSLQSGQDCNFTSPQGAVKGSCFAPEGKPLACRPKNPPGGARPAPKQ